MAKKQRIGSNGYVCVHTGADLSNADFSDFRYEHVVVAEEMLQRKLNKDEVVHHLDSNRSNNSPDNLLVMSYSSHLKLHRWLDKNIVIPSEAYAERIKLGCIRCEMCGKPINPDKIYCSNSCSTSNRHRVSKKPPRDILEELVKTKPMTTVGKELGVSDNAVRKWCLTEGIDYKNK